MAPDGKRSAAFQRSRNDSDGDGLWDDEERKLGTDPHNADSDGDGLRDSVEVKAGTDPTVAEPMTGKDSDGDGLSDADEGLYGSDPHDSDTDADGLRDGEEALLGTDLDDSDTDRDSILDGDETIRGGGPSAWTDPTKGDSDADGVRDDLDDRPLQADDLSQVSPWRRDTDGDGVRDQEEERQGTDPNNPDTDGDGFNDDIDVAPERPNKFNDPSGDGDYDGDGVDNRTEKTFGSDPFNPDTLGTGQGDRVAVDAAVRERAALAAESSGEIGRLSVLREFGTEPTDAELAAARAEAEAALAQPSILSRDRGYAGLKDIDGTEAPPEHVKAVEQFFADTEQALVNRDPAAFGRAFEASNGRPPTADELDDFTNPDAISVLGAGRQTGLLGIDVPEGSKLDGLLGKTFAGMQMPGAPDPTAVPGTGTQPGTAPGSAATPSTTAGVGSGTGTGSTAGGDGAGGGLSGGFGPEGRDRTDVGDAGDGGDGLPGAGGTGGAGTGGGAGAGSGAGQGPGSGPGSSGGPDVPVPGDDAPGGGSAPAPPSESSDPVGDMGSRGDGGGSSLPASPSMDSFGPKPAGDANTGTGAGASTTPGGTSGADVEAEYDFSDGEAGSISPTGGQTEDRSDGTSRTTRPDGSVVQTDKDGNVIYDSRSGQGGHSETGSDDNPNSGTTDDDGGSGGDDGSDDGSDDSGDDSGDDGGGDTGDEGGETAYVDGDVAAGSGLLGFDLDAGLTRVVIHGGDPMNPDDAPTIDLSGVTPEDPNAPTDTPQTDDGGSGVFDLDAGLTRVVIHGGDPINPDHAPPIDLSGVTPEDPNAPIAHDDVAVGVPHEMHHGGMEVGIDLGGGHQLGAELGQDGGFELDEQGLGIDPMGMADGAGMPDVGFGGADLDGDGMPG